MKSFSCFCKTRDIMIKVLNILKKKNIKFVISKITLLLLFIILYNNIRQVTIKKT